MGTKKLAFTHTLNIVKRTENRSAKTLINSLIPNFTYKNSNGELLNVDQAII